MKIKLRFAKNNTFVSYVVRFFTWSKVSHVDYVFDDGRFYGALPSTGVDFNKTRFDNVEYYEVEVKDKTKIEEYLLSQRGKRYDMGAIAGFPFRRKWQDESDWFCSELIAAAIEQDTKLFNNTEMYRITPRDLYINPLLKKVE